MGKECRGKRQQPKGAGEAERGAEKNLWELAVTPGDEEPGECTDRLLV